MSGTDAGALVAPEPGPSLRVAFEGCVSSQQSRSLCTGRTRSFYFIFANTFLFLGPWDTPQYLRVR